MSWRAYSSSPRSPRTTSSGCMSLGSWGCAWLFLGVGGELSGGRTVLLGWGHWSFCCRPSGGPLWGGLCSVAGGSCKSPWGPPKSSRGLGGLHPALGSALLQTPCRAGSLAVGWGTGSCGGWLLMDTVLPRGSQAAVGAPGRHRLLEKELRELQAAERQLDDLIQMCTVQLRLLTEDPANQQYPLVLGRGWPGGGCGWWHRQDASQPTSPIPSLTRPTAAYVTCQDLRSIVDPAEQMVMVIKAPPETQLQVSDPAEVSWGHALLLLCPPWASLCHLVSLLSPPQAFQVSVRSTQGPIDVFLCPEDSSGVCSPVKSPFKAPAEDSSPSHSQPRASLLLHPAQDVNMSLLPGEQGGPGHTRGLGTRGRSWWDVTVALISPSEVAQARSWDAAQAHQQGREVGRQHLHSQKSFSWGFFGEYYGIYSCFPCLQKHCCQGRARCLARARRRR
uniref:E2F transcription factor 1 n=1 Tax=Serinus canaria TaxID=9135 RepID=A0A8C9UCR9_SERCA